MSNAFDKWGVLDQEVFEGQTARQRRLWTPHPGQLRVAESKARNRVVSAGRRFGKSDIGGHELIPEALYTAPLADQLKEEGNRREFWIVGPEYSDSEKEFRVFWNKLVKLGVPMDKPGSYNDPISGSLHVSLWGGAFQVHGKSAKYPDSLVGEALSGVILAEAAKLKEKVWTKYIRPTLADFGGWSLMTSTPEGKNWFYDYWQRGQNPNNHEWESWRMPSWINPHVYKTLTKSVDVKRLQNIMRMPGEKRGIMEICIQEGLIVDAEIISLLNDLTIEAFNQEIAADFTEFVGRVFKEFDEEVHVADLPYNPNWETYAAVDYGFTNPNVWLLIQVGPWGEINVIDELYQSGLTTEEFAEEIISRGLCPSGVRAFYPDPASPGDSRILQQKLRVRSKGGTGGLIQHRIDAIRKALKESPLHVPFGHVDRRPQIMWDHRCKKSIYEMNEYKYPEKKEESSTPGQENPMKKDDHTPEALGRFFAGHFGTPQSTATGSRSRRANFKRS